MSQGQEEVDKGEIRSEEKFERKRHKERESSHLVSERQNPEEALIERRDEGRNATVNKELLNETESTLRGERGEIVSL